MVASGVPSQPTAPSTELDSLDVKISWTAPNANYGGITAYELAIADSTGTAITETTYCGSSTAEVFSQLYCLVPMAYLRETYGLARGDLVEASVRAQGLNGWGAWSSETSSGVTVETAPSQMNTPTEGTLTNEAQIEIEWAALSTAAETGGSTILSYNLQWHDGLDDIDASWVSLAGDISEYPGTSYIVTLNVERGATYRFRIRAKNLWGYGDYSSTVALVASAAPDQVDTAATSIDSSTGDLVISWVAPDDHGSPITAYRIEVRDKAGSSWTAHSSCDGSSASAVSAV